MHPLKLLLSCTVDLLVDGGMCQSEPPGAYYSRRLGDLLRAGAPHFGKEEKEQARPPARL